MSVLPHHAERDIVVHLHGSACGYGAYQRLEFSMEQQEDGSTEAIVELELPGKYVPHLNVHHTRRYLGYLSTTAAY